MIHFGCQANPKYLDVFAESDWAGDARGRKSVSGGIVLPGRHLLESYCAGQQAVVLSSGEAEFYAVIRAAVEAKFIANLLKWLDFDVQLEAPEIVSDATAAIGAATRLGAGKRMKHIETQHF